MCVDAPVSTTNSRSSAPELQHECITSLCPSSWTCIAQCHAALRARPSCCKVSSCDLSPNFGAQKQSSWGVHFWIISRHVPFLSRILMWCQTHLENLAACFDPNFPRSRRIDFSRIRILRYASQKCIDSFNNATAPFPHPFFDFLLDFPWA